MKDLLSNDEATAALDSLVQPKPQVATNVFDIPQQQYPHTNFLPDLHSLPQDLNLPHTITSQSFHQMKQTEFQPMEPQTYELDTVPQDEVPMPKPTNTKNEDQKGTRNLEGKIPWNGCEKTFTRKHNLEEHKI